MECNDISSELRKTIVITGGATGIGRETANRFAKANYNVAFCDVNDSEADNLIAHIASLNLESRILYHHADTKERSQIRAFVESVIDEFKQIDALFVNAGIHRSNTMLNISDEELELMINTNIYGSVYTMQEVVPYMQKSGGGAIIINDSDQWYIGKRNNFGYGLTKGALGQITRSLALELAADKIRVCAVCCGTVKTPLADQALEKYANRVGISLEQAWAEEDSLFPLGRAGKAEEAAEMVFFLVDKGTFCTGGHYLVDGGLVAG